MKWLIYPLIGIFLILNLSACASKPVVVGDKNENFIMANRNVQSQAVNKERVTTNIQSLLLKTNQTKMLTGVAAVQQVNKRSIALPNSVDTLNSIIIFQYQAGDLYQIYTTPLNITDIALQAGEQIISVAAGDTSRWQVSKTVSGSGGDRVEHLLIKPLAENITTTLIVMTNARVYHLLIKATHNTFMAAVKWRYDGQEMLFNKLSDDSSYNEDGPSIDMAQIHFPYQLKQIKGSKPDWIPVAIFTDGEKTYIQFPKDMQTAPDLFVAQSDGSEAVINYRVVKNDYVIDQMLQRAKLVSDNGKTVVEIIKTE